MPRLIAYVRVSSEEQAQSGLGIEAQLEAIKKTFGEPDLVFRDEPGHGDDPERPGLLSALEELGRGDTLAVAKRDRLARQMFLSLWIEKEVQTARAVIVSAEGESTEDEDPAKVLLRRMKDAFAEYEIAIIRRRTSAAVKIKMQNKRNASEKTGGRFAPFGWDVILIDGVKKLVENTEEQATIKAMITMRKAGASYQSIAERLDADGIKTRGGGKWTHKVIRAIIGRSKVAATDAA